MSNLYVDLASVEEALPKGVRLPPLLQRFAEWASGEDDGSLGYFDGIMGDQFSDGAFSEETNTRIDEAVGPFLALGDGSFVALWKYGRGAPAVVLIDSEGQHRNVATTLERFFIAWSKRQTDVSDLDAEEREPDDPPLAHERLSEWLKAEGVRAGRSRKVPDFAEWIGQMGPASGEPSDLVLPEPPADMGDQVTGCMGGLTHEEPLAGFLKSLGIDLRQCKSNDDFVHFLVPEHGYSFELNWPWAYPSRAPLFDKAAKTALKRAKARMLWSASFYRQGYRGWGYQRGDYVTFEGFPHALPWNVSFDDDKHTLIKKLGPPAFETSTTLHWDDSERDIRFVVSFADDEDSQEMSVAVGAITEVTFTVPPGY